MKKPTLEERIDRLNRASLRDVIEPATDVQGHVGSGQVVADELLSIHGLDVELTAEQRAQLSREEIAAVFDLGIRFEALLMSGFCLHLATSVELRDPRTVYALHEVGEETRHSRLFLQVIEQLQPTARNPLLGQQRFGRWLEKRADFAIMRRPALFNTLVLAGEEIPDLIQKRAGEHPDTDPFLAAVNRYHRSEEARHVAFARLRVAEVWRDATWGDRYTVRHVAPLIIYLLCHAFVHPGVYEVVGLPKWRTWRTVRRLPARREFQYRTTRSVLAALIAGGAFRPGSIPRAWRRLCNVDRHGTPITARTTAPTAPLDSRRRHTDDVGLNRSRLSS
ncbi:MAG: diiron oxygenase [Mycobacterium sp.]